MALGGCSGPAAAPAPLQWPPTHPTRLPPDAPPVDAPPPLALRGEACGVVACADGLTCSAAQPGGYCTSSCTPGTVGAECPEGECVATARSGAQCLRRCTADADCRVVEGYVCDRDWHACLIPNTAVIAPRQCAAPRIGHDRSFGAATRAGTSTAAERDPSAVVTDTGEVVTWASGETHAQPRLARDKKGILYAVWLAVEGTQRRVQLARSRDGGKTWGKADTVDAAQCDEREPACLDRPAIAIGAASPATGNDLVYVLYAAGGGIRVATSHDEGATFRRPVTAVPGLRAAATVGADGKLHVVALDPGTAVPGFGSADHRIVYTVSADAGKTFAKAQRLSGRDELLPFHGAIPAIAVDTKRKVVYAAYLRGGRDAVWDLVIASSKLDGKNVWKRTRLGEDGCATQLAPALALDPTTGVLHVAWYDNRGGGRFAHATCPAGAATCTQQGAISDAPFAAFVLDRDPPRSLGDTSALVIDVKRRALHAVWAQPIIDDGRITTRIERATATLPKK